jgi:hypothetical protein
MAMMAALSVADGVAGVLPSSRDQSVADRRTGARSRFFIAADGDVAAGDAGLAAWCCMEFSL